MQTIDISNISPEGLAEIADAAERSLIAAKALARVTSLGFDYGRTLRGLQQDIVNREVECLVINSEIERRNRLLQAS